MSPLFAKRKFTNGYALSWFNFNPSHAEHDMPCLTNSVDPDQLASEANWSESALFVIKYVNFYQKTRIK